MMSYKAKIIVNGKNKFTTVLFGYNKQIEVTKNEIKFKKLNKKIRIYFYLFSKDDLS